MARQDTDWGTIQLLFFFLSSILNLVASRDGFGLSVVDVPSLSRRPFFPFFHTFPFSVAGTAHLRCPPILRWSRLLREIERYLGLFLLVFVSTFDSRLRCWEPLGGNFGPWRVFSTRPAPPTVSQGLYYLHNIHPTPGTHFTTLVQFLRRGETSTGGVGPLLGHGGAGETMAPRPSKHDPRRYTASGTALQEERWHRPFDRARLNLLKHGGEH